VQVLLDLWLWIPDLPLTRQSGMTCEFSTVMLGLVPGIYVLGRAHEGVDGRDKPGHDERCGW
jgi:hypothetical protein